MVVINCRKTFTVHDSCDFTERPRLPMPIPTNVQNLSINVVGLGHRTSIVGMSAQHPRAMRHFIPHVNWVVTQHGELPLQDGFNIMTHEGHVAVLKGISILTLAYQLAIDILLLRIVVVSPQSQNLLALNTAEEFVELVQRRIQAKVTEEQQGVSGAHSSIDCFNDAVIVSLRAVVTTGFPHKISLVPQMQV